MAYMVVWGEVQYSDMFGKHHWTRFCEGSGIDAESIASEKCAKYSSVDNN